MSDVNGVNSSTNVFTSLNQEDEVKQETDSDMFMKLLIANIKNQDPTSPAETGEFMQQISNMSMVEGINNLNTTMEEMNTSILSSQTALQASSLVGRTVYVDTDNAYADSTTGQIQGVIELDENASGVTISVFDSAGAFVESFDMDEQDAGDVEFAWQLEEGMSLGGYSFSATALVDGDRTEVPVFIGMNVNSVTLGQNGVGMTINTSDGPYSLDDIKQIGV